MYCSTCGAAVPEGRSACDTCGTRQAYRSHTALGTGHAPPGSRGASAALAASSCPRCGYLGEGLPYFSRGRNVAALVGATMLTAGAMGAGGIIYYVVRKDHRVCPRCGGGWGRGGEHAVVRVSPPAAEQGAPVVPGRWAESGKRGWAIALFVMAALLVVGGIAGAEVPALLMAGMFAAGGLLLQRSADKDRSARREAMLSSLQLPVLRLAAERQGRLTVTETAAALGWTLPRAEKVLQSLDDGLRVSSEVTDEGVIVYEFRELLLTRETRPRLTD